MPLVRDVGLTEFEVGELFHGELKSELLSTSTEYDDAPVTAFHINDALLEVIEPTLKPDGELGIVVKSGPFTQLPDDPTRTLQ